MTNAGASGDGLHDGPGFVEHEHYLIVEVNGSEARGWLNDLVTGPVGKLRPGRATRSLLLTTTGRIRADFTVADVGILTLFQDRAQPYRIDQLLARYVLSADVELTEASERLALLTLPGAQQSPDLPEGVRAFSPSVLGPGIGLLVDRERASQITDPLAASFARAEEEALERWRIVFGIPRFGVDFQEGALPAQAGLEETIDFTKGCFLGQESVARVRNLGHPPTVLLALRASEPVATGDTVQDGDTDVGVVTSSAISPDETLLLAVVTWEARNDALTAAEGTPLEPRTGRSPA
jgi:folate-binding protein YgfZ